VQKVNLIIFHNLFIYNKVNTDRCPKCSVLKKKNRHTLSYWLSKCPVHKKLNKKKIKKTRERQSILSKHQDEEKKASYQSIKMRPNLFFVFIFCVLSINLRSHICLILFHSIIIHDSMPAITWNTHFFFYLICLLVHMCYLSWHLCANALPKLIKLTLYTFKENIYSMPHSPKLRCVRWKYNTNCK